MGWTCQHDHKGYCKLVKKECVPGMKGCILKSSDGIVFTTGSFENDKKAADEKQEEIDFAELAKKN
jgi:mRNA degradation ribonuclease J1/J2